MFFTDHFCRNVTSGADYDCIGHIFESKIEGKVKDIIVSLRNKIIIKFAKAFLLPYYMKISPSTKGLIISVVTVLVAFGIYNFFLAKRNYYLVDNPSENIFYFKINNGEEKTITAGQKFQVDLKKGKNEIKVFDKQKKMLFDSSFVVKKNRGLLNIAHQDYYINEQFYGYGLNKDSLIATRKQTTIDGKLFVNMPIRFSKLYTDDFYYNIDEEYDGVVKNIQKVESRTKIFRKADFLNYYREYYKF